MREWSRESETMKTARERARQELVEVRMNVSEVRKWVYVIANSG